MSEKTIVNYVILFVSNDCDTNGDTAIMRIAAVGDKIVLIICAIVAYVVIAELVVNWLDRKRVERENSSSKRG